MNEHLLKMGAAFAVGTGSTAGILWLLGFLPVPGYVKRVLGIAVPIPVMLVALVMLYYGPGALPAESETLPAPVADMRKMFFYGILTALAYLLVSALVQSLLRKTAADGEE